MPISSTSRKAGPFYGNGAATTFTFDFKIFEPSELRVVRFSSTLGVDLDLVAGVDYSITLNPDQDEAPGGEVILAVAPAIGGRVVLLSDVPDIQPVDLTNQGGFYPDLLNGGLDRSTILVQQLREKLGRAIKLPPTAEDGEYVLPLPQGNQLLAWGQDGKTITNLDPGELISVVTYGNTKADKFDGDGATTVFALTASPGSANNLAVSIDGVVQVPGDDYSWGGGKVLAFAVAPPAGTRIFVRYQEALDEGTDVSAKADKNGSNIDPDTDAPLFRDNVGLRSRKEYPILSDLTGSPVVPGVTDIGPLLARTDVGFTTLPPGDFRVKSNCTVQRPLYFAPGSRMTIDDGVQVTFTGKGRIASDSRRQIIAATGTGRVRGLPFVDVTWFAGDKVYFLTNDQMISQGEIPSADLGLDAWTEVQKAFASVKLNGCVQLQEGCLTLNGAAPVELLVNASVKGDKQASIFVFSGDATNGFRLSYEKSSMSGFWLRKANLNKPSTTGAALVAGGGQSHFFDFFINGCFVGADSNAQSGGTWENFSIHNAREIGISLIDTNDPIVQNGFIVADDEFLTLTTLAGGFSPVPGDTLTGATSGCKMRLKRIGSGHHIVTRFYADANKPVVGETVTSSSGGTAVIGAYVPQHNLGGVRVVQTAAAGVSAPMAEAIMLHNLDIIGGRHNMTIDGAGTALRQGPSYNRATNVWFDSALESALSMANTDGWTFTGGCIQSRFDGLAAQAARNIRFIGTDIRHCSGAGAIIRPGCVLDFTSCTIADNRYGVAGNAGAHVYIENDPFTRITFSGGSISQSTRSGGGVVTDYGIDLIGAGGQLFLWGVRFGPKGVDLREGAVRNLSSLAVYTVDGCTGLTLKRKGAFVISTGQPASDPIPHGVTDTVTANDIRLTCSDPGGLGRAYAAGVPSEDITSSHFTVRLYDIDAAPVNAARNVTICWEIDKSYKV